MFAATRPPPETVGEVALEPRTRFVQLPIDSAQALGDGSRRQATTWQKLRPRAGDWDTHTQTEVLADVATLLYRYCLQPSIAIDVLQVHAETHEWFRLDLSLDDATLWQSVASAIRAQLADQGAPTPAALGEPSNVAALFVDGTQSVLAALDVSNFAVEKDLCFCVASSSDGVFVSIVYASQQVQAGTVERLLANLCVIQDARSHSLGTQVGELSLISESEEACISAFSTGGSATYDETDFLDAFAEQARISPRALAVTSRAETLTYGDLDRERLTLAKYLQSRGIGSGQKVAVCIRPSAPILIAMLAVWSVGAIYVPIDPTHPEAFIRRVLEDVSPALVLTTKELQSLTAGQVQVHLDEEHPRATATEAQALPSRGLSDPAYVFYTSGTTGRAKGVVATHGNLIQYLRSAAAKYGFGPSDSFISIARYTFSISLWELLSPLLCGGRLRILEREKVLAPSSLFQELGDVTVLHAGPSLLGSLFRYLKAQAEPPPQLPRMRHASSGGDMVSPAIMQEMQYFFPNAELYVIYGCTEVSCMGTTYAIRRDAKPTGTFVGKPFPNVTCRVLSKAGQPMPLGAVGEICFTGAGIVLGYLNLPDLTAQKFAASQGSRCYHTGDLGRLHSDGNLEILGRSDYQVQLNGMRIELAGIESTIVELGLAAQVALIAKTLAAGDVRLVAFVVKPEDSTAAHFRRRLGAQLPEYMVPHQIVVLDAMPLTANGKLDRNQLSQIPWDECVAKSLGERKVAPTYASATEQVIASVFARVLNRESVDVDENFFDMGGHSLLGIVALQEIEHTLGIAIPPHVLFEGGTVRELARITSGEATGEATGRSSDGLKPILLNSPGRPQLFMLSGVHIYRELARRLDGCWSAYGVFDPMEVGSLEPVPGSHSVEDLAQTYLKTIRKLQPEGPYHLLGYSFAGLVAYEMARELVARGEEVATLTLLDAHLPEWILGLRYRVSQLKRVWNAPTKDVLAFIVRKARETLSHHGYEPARYQDDAQVAPLEAQRDITNRDAAATYFLQLSPYAGDMTLIVAGARLREDPLKSPSCGWDAYASKLEVYQVDTDHYKMLSDDPYVSQVAGILSRARRRFHD